MIPLIIKIHVILLLLQSTGAEQVLHYYDLSTTCKSAH